MTDRDELLADRKATATALRLFSEAEAECDELRAEIERLRLHEACEQGNECPCYVRGDKDGGS